MKILVVDDERAVRESLRRALQLEGYEIELAADGGEALSVLTAEQPQPDAVILDVLMPGVDGLEVCRRLRDTGNRVPVRQHHAARMSGAPRRVLQKRHVLGPRLDERRRRVVHLEIERLEHGAHVRGEGDALVKLDLPAKLERKEVSVALRRGVSVGGSLTGPAGEAIDKALVFCRVHVTPLSPFWRFPEEVHEMRARRHPPAHLDAVHRERYVDSVFHARPRSTFARCSFVAAVL